MSASRIPGQFVVPTSPSKSEVELIFKAPDTDAVIESNALEFFRTYAQEEWINGQLTPVRKFIWFVLAHFLDEQVGLDVVSNVIPDGKLAQMFYATFVLGMIYGRLTSK